MRLKCGGTDDSDIVTMFINAVNEYTLYIDGISVSQSKDWTETALTSLPVDFQVLAVEAKNYGDGDVGGIIISVIFKSILEIHVCNPFAKIPELELVSDSSWRCVSKSQIEAHNEAESWMYSNFSGVHWPEAIGCNHRYKFLSSCEFF